MCFFGDGATDEGVFYESLNFAALKAVPLIFVCENNSYAIHTHISRRQSRSESLVDRVCTYGMPAERIEANDVLKIHERVTMAVQALRSGQPGPFFFECMTYRWKEHVGPGEDYDLGFRSREEAEPWMVNDQVKRMAEALTPGERQGIEGAVEEEIQDAFAFAEASPFPESGELYSDVFQEG